MMIEPKRLIRIDVYTDENKKPTTPDSASIRFVTKFSENGDEETWEEYSENGFKVDFDETFMNYYEGDVTPPEPPDEDDITPPETNAEESNPNRNPDGIFASSDGDQTGGTLNNHTVSGMRASDDTRIEDKKDSSKIEHKVKESN